MVGGVGGGVGVNIVMISPEFPSSGPMRRERDGERKGGRKKERAAAVLSPPATLTVVTPPPRPHAEGEEREGCSEKIEMLTHTRTHSKQPQRAPRTPLIVQLKS